MKSLLRRRPSPAMVIALIALFVSLSGVSYGVATGFIDSREIKNNEVRSLDVRNNEIRTIDLRNNQVRGIDIRNSTVQGRDLALNTVTGDDVREDTLQKVPSALLADSATSATTAGSAGSAGSVDGLTFVDATVARGAVDATLATNGPLTLLGECTSNAANTVANLTLNTSENNTIVADQTNAEPDLDAAEPPYVIRGVTDATGGNRAAEPVFFHATAPSGPAFTGNVSVQSQATSPTAGTCRFQGFVVLPG